LRELDDNNPEDRSIKLKISSFCQAPQRVRMSRTATTDLGLASLTKEGMLTGLREHILGRGRVFTDRMDNGDTAYIAAECLAEEKVLYIKVRFFELDEDEAMLVFSAHPPRRWC
jgi:hypothetical protein